MDTADMIREANRTFETVRLFRPSAEALEGAALPAESTLFLRASGLPACRAFGFSFAPVQDLFTVDAYAASNGYPTPGDDRGTATCVGDSYGALMVITPSTGHVVWTDLHRKHEDLFVNSSVQALAACLAAYASLAPLRRTRTPADLSSKLAARLVGIDAATTEGYWTFVLEEVSRGLS